MSILLVALLAATANARLEPLASRPGELAIEVRGTPWIISTGSGAGTCSKPPVRDSAGVYQCWNTDGDGAVVDVEDGCIEISGAGYCGPVSKRHGSRARFSLVCDSGTAYVLTFGNARVHCWTSGEGPAYEATCGDGATLAASQHYAVAGCDRGCVETGGSGGCSAIESAVRERPSLTHRIVIELPPEPDDEE